MCQCGRPVKIVYGKEGGPVGKYATTDLSAWHRGVGVRNTYLVTGCSRIMWYGTLGVGDGGCIMRPHFKQVSNGAGDSADDPELSHGISSLVL